MEDVVATAWRWWLSIWPHVLGTSILAINVLASGHAILVKRDTRSTIGWVGLIWLSPVFGAIAYAVLAIFTFVSGLFFAAVYVRTRNLLLVVALHALGNTPTLLIAAPAWLHALVLLVAFVVLLVRGPRWLRSTHV